MSENITSIYLSIYLSESGFASMARETARKEIFDMTWWNYVIICDFSGLDSDVMASGICRKN